MSFNNYYISKTSKMEERCFQLLKSLGFAVEKNNVNSTDFDFKIKQDKKDESKGYKYLDFQFSANFAKYGDLRFDLLSCFHNTKGTTREEVVSRLKQAKTAEEIVGIFQELYSVKKLGKIFDLRLDSLIYFIFNQEETKVEEDDIPCLIVSIPRSTILSFIAKNIHLYADNLKINNKTNCPEPYLSAFITIPYSVFSTSEEIYEINLNFFKNSLRK